MKKNILAAALLLSFTVTTFNCFSQGVGIGVTSFTADPSAILELRSTEGGLLVPRMTAAERDAISSPATGLLIFSTTTNQYNYYDGSVWQMVAAAGAGITSLNGLTGTSQTFVDGTNVIITSAGTTHTLGWTGQLSVADGGTGLSTFGGANTVLYTTAADAISSVSASTVAGQFLQTTTIGSAPTWKTIMGVANGGTGASSLTGVLFGNGASAYTAVASTGATQYLRRNAADNGYEFAVLTNSDVASGSANYIQNTGTQQASSQFNISGAGTLGGLLTANLGLTSLGATINLNASSNFATNINTGTSTGAINIGGTSGSAVSIASGVNTSAQSVDIGSGASAANNTINIGSGVNTAGVTAITMGSNANLANTTLIKGGNGVGAITMTPHTAGSIVIGATAGTGAITLGSSTAAQTLNLGTGSGLATVNMANGLLGSAVTIANGVNTVAQSVNIGAGANAANNTINIGSGVNTAGVTAVTMGSNANLANTTLIKGGNGASAITLTPQTTGGIVIGATAGTGAITLGSSTAAQTLNLGTGAGLATVNIASGLVGSTVRIANGANTVAQSVNIGAGASAANNTINIGSGVNTAGVTAVTIGSNANLANTTTIKGGNGASAINVTPQTTGVITIGAAAGTGAINLGSSSAAQTVNIGSSTGVTTVNIATGNVAGIINIGDNTGATSSKLLMGGAITVNGPFNYSADGGASDTYVVTPSPAITAYATGMMISFLANTGNTGACTVNVNGLGAKAIRKRLNTVLATGDILAGMTCLLIYDGTNFIIMNPVVN